MEVSKNWSILSLVGSNPWQFTRGYAASGKTSLYVEDVGRVSDSVALQKTGVTIPAGAFLHFKHAFDLEANYDAGVLEYSIGSNGPWTDAKPLFLAGQNYNGTVSSSSGNPLRQRSAFTNVSHGYVSSSYNLSILAGRVVRFRFRQANDTSMGSLGWLVDDVRIYTCR